MPRDRRFDEAVLPHLDAAYNLARWLMRDESEASDAVQDACVRALRFIGGLRGQDGKLWLLKIVRNTCYSRLAGAGKRAGEAEFDEDLHSLESDDRGDPEMLLARARDQAAITLAIEELPDEFREVIVMRELEGLSYQQIAAIAGVPAGTVMSRLARARSRLRRMLAAVKET